MVVEAHRTSTESPTALWRRITAAAIPLYVLMIVDLMSVSVALASLGNQRTASLAAFTFAGAVFAPASAAVAGALRGVMPFVAPHKGARDRVVPILRDGRWLAFSFGAAGGVVLLCLPLLARATGIPEATRSQLGLLPIIMAAGLLVQAINQGAGSALIALDRSRDVLWPGLVETALIIGLSLAFVNGIGPIPPLGAQGAGAALLASSAVESVITNWRLRRVCGTVGWGRPRLIEIKALAKVSVPLAGTALVKFGTVGVLAFAAARIGTVQAAGHGILIAIANVLKYAATAVGQATIPIMSRCAKDGDHRGIRRAARASLLVSMVPSAVAVLILLVLGSTVTSLFTDDAAVRVLVVAVIPLLIGSALAESVLSVMSFGLTALKRTAITFNSYVIFYGLLALTAFPISQALGLRGLWGAFVVANLLLVVRQGMAFLKQTTPATPKGATT